MFVAMLVVLSGWAALALAFAAIGAAVCRLTGLVGPARRAVFWIGLAAVISFLQFWHLVLPVDGRAVGAIALLAAAGGLWSARKVAARLLRSWRSEALTVVPTLLLATWLANRALMPPANGDTGQYFLQAVKWIVSYPIVPGLGNLDGRLGFNQAYFLYAGLLDAGPFSHRGHHLANGLLVLVLAAAAIRALRRALGPGLARPEDLFCVFLFPAVMELALGANVSSPAADLLAHAIGLAVLPPLVARASARSFGSSAFFVCWLALLGVVVKLSFAGLALPLLAIVAARWIRAGRPTRPALAVAAIAGGVLVPWAIRGIVLTGYPLYPSTIGAFDVDWRVPEETVRDLADYILAWGRRPGVPYREVLGSLDWIGPWLRQASLQTREVLVPLSIAAVGLAIGVGGRRPTQLGWATFAAPVGALLFWLVTSPDTRFAGAAFWLLAAMAALRGLDRLGVRSTPAILHSAFGVCAVVSLLPVVVIGAGGLVFRGPPAAKLPRPALVPSSGVNLAEGGACWDAPLPCTSVKNPRLRRRDRDELVAGFRVDPGGTPITPYRR